MSVTRTHVINMGGFLFFALLLGGGLLFALAVIHKRRGEKWPDLWLSASPLRATLETILLAAALVAISLALSAPAQGNEPTFPVDPGLVLLAGPICALWCAVRLRIPRGPRWRWMLVESVIGAILAIAPFALTAITAYTVYLFLERQNDPAITLALDRGIRGLPLPLFAVLLFLAFSLEFVVFRIGVRLWLRLNRLRRTQMQWSLTYGILVTAALAAASLIVLIVFIVLLASSGTSITSLTPIIFFLGFLSVIGLLIVLPPSAIFSYVFARYMTRRLDTLIAATGALRAGDYSARAPVMGEDEVAQLQTNFNAMATDLERAVRELHDERDRVATLLRARRELVASVSHELRTPVATLRGYLESARMEWDRNSAGSTDSSGDGSRAPATLRHDLEVMERETVALQALINDLFTLSRAEVAALDLVIAPTDVAALARRVVETMAKLAWQSNRVELVATSSGALPLALADAGRLEQVLSNLLHNAVRHTPPGGIVAVDVASDPADAGSVVLRIKDTGEGIAPDDLPYVFERFYRGSNAGEGSGSGLGLALVKELSEAMGGTVAVESAPGAGAIFTVRLAAVRSPASQRLAAVDPDRRAGDVAGGVGGEEEHERGDLLARRGLALP